MRIVTTPRAEPGGWSPGPVAPATSSRAPGLLRGALDAWRGRAETAAGAALTAPQIAMLAPFLAGAAQLAEDVVRADLQRVRVLQGGPAAGAGNVATTIGTSIYVSDARYATQILSWAGRGWLVHELGHTMQWRRIGADQASDGARDRSFLNAYVGGFARHDGTFRDGGLVQAFRELQRRRRDGAPIGKVADLLHDTHPLEREAEHIAQAFRAATR